VPGEGPQGVAVAAARHPTHLDLPQRLPQPGHQHQLLERVRMNGPEHYRAAEHLLSDASFTDSYGNPVRRDGTLMNPGEHASLTSKAQVHATLALAAAAALQAALPLIGDDQQVSDWCKAIGTTVDTNQGACINNALSLIDEMAEDGRIIDGAHRLRAALGQTGGHTRDNPAARPTVRGGPDIGHAAHHDYLREQEDRD
jgi:hypothetical protein